MQIVKVIFVKNKLINLIVEAAVSEFLRKTKKDIDKPAVFQYNTHVSHVNDS